MQPIAITASQHFELKRLADGIYAAIGTTSGAAYSNAGILDLGDRILIFDTFDTPTAAQDLQAAVEKLTPGPVTCIINSHTHLDHWCGNQVFSKQVPILATHKTREMMPAFVEFLQQVKQNPSELEAGIRKNQARLEIETDPRWRATLEISVSRARYDLESLPHLTPRLPDQTFEGKLVFHGSRRRAELLTQGKGHTDSDAYLVLPEDGIVFMGDLGFFRCQPFMADGDPLGWRAQLDAMERSGLETFVPGHGPLGTKADLAVQREYITLLEQLVAQMIQDGKPVEETLQRPLPAPFDQWLIGGMGRFERNVRSSYERQSRR